jgi:hypothetical protein
MKLSILTALALCGVTAVANGNGHGKGSAPQPTTFVNGWKPEPSRTLTTCVVQHTAGIDDAPAVNSAAAACATNGFIEFTNGVTYNIWSPVYFEDLVNTTISIQGNLTLPQNISAVQYQVSIDDSKVGNGYWFVITGTNVVVHGNIHDSNWGWIECYGQQWWNHDCLTLSNGATNIEFRDSFCANGHGVSIGSLETNALVQNFTAENIYVQNALYGARFKAWLNGNGVVENILYKNFYVDNCTIPIFITQSYYDQETSSGSTGPVYQSIDLIKFNFTGFRGTINGYTQYHQVDPSGTWWDVPGLTGRDAIVMECPSEDACAGLHFSDIDISADWDGSRVTEVWCENGDNATLGFNCVNGTLVMN